MYRIELNGVTKRFPKKEKDKRPHLLRRGAVNMVNGVGYRFWRDPIVDNVATPAQTQESGWNTVLNGIDLRIKQGEFVTLIGGSGSGKSTVFNHILGSMFPTEGSVLVDGTPVERVGPDRGIVPQKYSLFPNLSVRDNISFGLMLSGTSLTQRVLHTPHYWRTRREARERAAEVITQLGLEPRDAEKFPYELSGGMRQRVAIGMSIVMEPKILMMDEPFGALDPETRTMMQALIRQIWKERKLTVLFVTHELSEAVYLGTRIVGLSKHWLGPTGEPGEGAKIVLDRAIDNDQLNSPGFRDSADFKALCVDIQGRVLDSTKRTPLSQFELTHPDAVKPARTEVSS